MSKKCVDTKCKLWLEKENEKNNKLIGYYERQLNKIKLSRKKCKNEACSRIDRIIKQRTQFIKSLKHLPKKEIRENRKNQLESCQKVYCNTGCKNTIMQDGEPDKLPAALKKELNHKILIDFNIRKRKDMFGTKKSVLRDGFYEGLSSRTVKKMKKEGAISGCLKNVSHSWLY